MEAQWGRALKVVRRPRDDLLRMGDILQRRRDDGGQEGRDAETGIARGDGPDGRRIGGEVVPERAVELEVYEAGRDDETGGVERLCAFGRRNGIRRANGDDVFILDQHGGVRNFLVGRV